MSKSSFDKVVICIKTANIHAASLTSMTMVTHKQKQIYTGGTDKMFS